jgi:hypothetical protein
MEKIVRSITAQRRGPGGRCRVRLVAALLLAFSTVHGVEPQLRLLEALPGDYLTPTIRLSAPSASRIRELRLADRSLLLGPGEAVHYAAGSVVVLAESPAGTWVRLFDQEGRKLREATLPASSSILAFGGVIGSHAPSLHEPGFPYALDLLTAAGPVRLERKARTIAGTRPLERHFVVSSVSDDGSPPMLHEVIDGAGTTAWTFESAGPALPRIVVRDEVAAAVHPARPDSRIQLSLGVGADPVERLLSGALISEVAFLRDRPALVAWGAHDVALIDLDPPEVRWRRRLERPGRFLKSDTPLVHVVGDTLTLLTRGEIDPGIWRVQAIFLRLADGRLSGRQELFRSGAVPTHARYFRRHGDALVVLPDRVFELRGATP